MANNYYRIQMRSPNWDPKVNPTKEQLADFKVKSKEFRGWAAASGFRLTYPTQAQADAALIKVQKAHPTFPLHVIEGCPISFFTI